jgi:hypothetical protein
VYTELKLPADYEKSQAWAQAVELVQEVHRLRKGLPPYDLLSQDERNEQLRQLAPDPEDVGPPQFDDVRSWTDERLIDFIADPMPGEDGFVGEAAEELERRLEAVERRLIYERELIEDRHSQEQFERLEESHDHVECE